MPALRACLHVKLAAPLDPVELNAQPATIGSRYRESEERASLSFFALPLHSKPEDIQHRRMALGLELRRVDELALGGVARPRRDCDVLAAVELERHGWSGEARAHVHPPQLLDGRIVIGDDRAVHEREEDKTAAGRERAA